MAVSVAAGASKLLEALEELGQWAGGDVRSAPAGPPARELVEAFNAFMQEPAPDVAPVAASAAAPVAVTPGPAQAMPAGATPGVTSGQMSGQVSGQVSGPTLEPAPALDTGRDVAVVQDASPGRDVPLGRDAVMTSGAHVSATERMQAAAATRPAPAGTEPPAGSVLRGRQRGIVDVSARLQGPQGSGAVSVSASSGGEHLHELARLLEQMSQAGATVRPDVLYRVQYLVGMLKIETQSGLDASQQTSQTLERLLKHTD